MTTPTGRSTSGCSRRRSPTALGFVFSRMWIGPPAMCTTLTPAEENLLQGAHGFPENGTACAACRPVMFRRELLGIAGLEPRTCHLELAMCRRWAAAGVRWAFVDRVTVDMYQHDDYPADGYPPSGDAFGIASQLGG